MRHTDRGFTLMEVMIAVAVGALTVSLAANVASMVIRHNTLGRQKNDLALRARLLSEQLAADIRLAGMGSTGAVGVDPDSLVLGDIALSATPSGGFPAIPAIAGANNLAVQDLATGRVRAGSDAIQIIVPNPRTAVRTMERARSGGNTLNFEPAQTLPGGCELAYIHDHTGPNGSGRTQVAWVDVLAPGRVQIDGTLMFSAAPGTEVMCARISTYWLDDNDWLHRSDLGRSSADQLGATLVWVNRVASGLDLLAPGIEDFQIAYRVSAEAYRLAVPPLTPPPPGADGRWAFANLPAPNPDALLTGPNTHAWFEVRLVRANILSRRLRRVVAANQPMTIPGAEDGVAMLSVDRAAGPEWVTVSEAVVNLRMFDSATAAEVAAEPY